MSPSTLCFVNRPPSQQDGATVRITTARQNTRVGCYPPSLLLFPATPSSVTAGPRRAAACIFDFEQSSRAASVLHVAITGHPELDPQHEVQSSRPVSAATVIRSNVHLLLSSSARCLSRLALPCSGNDDGR
jgi:hypothetical protein